MAAARHEKLASLFDTHPTLSQLQRKTPLPPQQILGLDSRRKTHRVLRYNAADSDIPLLGRNVFATIDQFLGPLAQPLALF